jgi:hypothetical protein
MPPYGAEVLNLKLRNSRNFRNLRNSRNFRNLRNSRNFGKLQEP